MKHEEELREILKDMMEDWTPSEILEGIARECAYWKRNDTADRGSWDRLRKMILKTAAIAREIGL